jgi:hypothetical protein
MRTKPITTMMLVLLIAGVTGCAHTPIQALQAYTDAYDKVREAGTLIYERAAPAFALDARQSSSSEGGDEQGDPLFPDTFERNSAPPSRAPIEARIQAMAAIATYDETLLKLATGGTIDSVRGDVGRLAQSVTLLAQVAGASLPFVGAVVEPLKGLIALAERARATAAARDALLKAAPTIRDMLAELDKDIDRLYAVQKARYQFEITIEARGKVADASVAILSFANRHQRPQADQLAVARAKLDDEFDALRAGIQGLKAEALRDVGGSGSASPYTPETEETLNGLMAALRSASESYRTKVREWRDYQAALQSYAALLHSTATSLDAAVTAAKTPSLSPAELYQLFSTVGDVRRDALHIVKILRDSQA